MASTTTSDKKDRFTYLRHLLSSIGLLATRLAFQSANFVEGVTGWRLSANGLIEGTRIRLDNFIGRNNASIVYVGTWADGSASVFYGGGVHASSTVGDTFTITFTGTSIGVVMEKSSAAGKVSFSLDGGTPTLVDLYSVNGFVRSIVYSATDLSEREHVLVGTVATKNASSSSNEVRVQGYVKSPTDGIKLDAISADLITIGVTLTTNGNGYVASTAPTLPSGYSAWCISGVRLTPTVMDSATAAPKLGWGQNAVYLYNGQNSTAYDVVVEFLVSKI